MPSTYGEWDKLIKDHEEDLETVKGQRDLHERLAKSSPPGLSEVYNQKYKNDLMNIKMMEADLDKYKKKRDSAPPGTTAVGGSRRKRTRANRKKNKRTRKH